MWNKSIQTFKIVLSQGLFYYKKKYIYIAQMWNDNIITGEKYTN